MTTPILEAVQIRRLHPDRQRWLLDEVSLEVRPGKPVSIVGNSGAGKTLLLRALALLDPVDSGEIRFQQTVPRHVEVPLFRSQVVYLHQRPALSGTTVKSVLRRPFSLAAHRHRSFSVERVAEWLDCFGREASFLTKSTAELSGGEQQITALIRAVQLDPVVLLLDEPTASLDRDTARAVETFLNKWLDESPATRSMVWVSHDIEQSRRMAHEIVFLARGKMGKESR